MSFKYFYNYNIYMNKLIIKPESLDKRVCIRLSRQEFISLREEALKSGLSLSNLLRIKLNSENNFFNEIQNKISNIIELQKEALSQLEFISLHVVREEKVKDK